MLRRVFLAFGATSATARAGHQDTSSPVVGRWSGDARFFDIAVRKQTGPVPVHITISSELVLSGQMGAAKIPPTAPRTRNAKRLEYIVKLDQTVHPDVRRTHLVVLISLGKSEHLDADFHLKSNFGLDLGMHVGHLDVWRQQ